jgi:hypothetical protein
MIQQENCEICVQKKTMQEELDNNQFQDIAQRIDRHCKDCRLQNLTTNHFQRVKA